MIARVGLGGDSQGVYLGRSGEVVELCRTGQPVMGWAPRVALDAGVVDASFLCGYADSHGRVGWLRGRSRGVRP